MPKIVIKKSNLLVRKIAIPEDILAFTVGSEQGNDIILEDDSVSFFHLQFEKQNNEYFVRDLQSQGGTFVNNRKITGRTQIKDNDEVGLGIHKLIFQLPKMENKTRFITETYETAEQDSQKLQERMAGVPTLMNLNSWLNDDPAPAFENNGDFYSDSNGPIHDTSEDLISEKSKESPLDFFDNKHQPNMNPELAFVENKNKKEPIFDFGAEAMTSPPPSSKLTLGDNGDLADLDELSRPAIEANKNYYLVAIYGYYLGRKFRLRHPDTRIGRDGKVNDIVIKKNSKGKIDQSVSRRHATISFRNGQYMLLDKRSKSRTYLNQNKLEPTDNVAIAPGDEIEIISDRKSHILRMVAEGDWNFSYPKKAGAWHIRHHMKLVAFYSLLLMAIGGFIFTKSFIIKNLIADKPNPLMVSEEKWISTASPAENDGEIPQPLSPPAIADFDGDKTIDFVYADSKGTLVCVSGNDGAPMWSGDFQVQPGTPITAEDLNKDGLADIIVVSKDLRVRALDGRLGIEIWKSQILEGPLVAPPAVGDFNKDGLKDLAVASEANAIYIGYSSLRNSPFVKMEIGAPIRGVVSVEDLYGDGAHKIMAGTETGKVIFIDGFSRKVLGEININEEFSKATGVFGQNHQIRHPITAGEINGDQSKDIVVLTQPGGLLALSGESLDRLWYHLPDSGDVASDGSAQNLLMGDLDGDNLLDVLVRTADGRLMALKGSGQGKDRKMVLWEKGDIQFAAWPSLADFNKNGTLDVVASDVAGQMFIIEGSSGEILWKNGRQAAALIGPPLISDFDNDHRLDIAVFKTDGQVYRLSTNCVTANNAVFWGQAFGNSKNTNSVVVKMPDILLHYAYMAGAVLLMALTVLYNFWTRKKRQNLGKV